MKKFAFALAAILIASPALAQSNTTSGSQSGAYSQSGVNIGGSPMQAPSAIAPGLIASGPSCLGSSSFGVSGAGFGISLGGTKEDEHCNAREDTRILTVLAGNAAGIARMCQVKANAKALNAAGIACPGQVARAGTTAVAPQPRVIRSGVSMAECRKMAAADPRITCRPR